MSAQNEACWLPALPDIADNVAEKMASLMLNPARTVPLYDNIDGRTTLLDHLGLNISGDKLLADKPLSQTFHNLEAMESELSIMASDSAIESNQRFIDDANGTPQKERYLPQGTADMDPARWRQIHKLAIGHNNKDVGVISMLGNWNRKAVETVMCNIPFDELKIKTSKSKTNHVAVGGKFFLGDKVKGVLRENQAEGKVTKIHDNNSYDVAFPDRDNFPMLWDEKPEVIDYPDEVLLQSCAAEKDTGVDDEGTPTGDVVPSSALLVEKGAQATNTDTKQSELIQKKHTKMKKAASEIASVCKMMQEKVNQNKFGIMDPSSDAICSFDSTRRISPKEHIWINERLSREDVLLCLKRSFDEELDSEGQ